MWFYKGIVLTHLKKYSSAIQSFQKSLLIDPTNADCWYNIGCAQSLNKNVNDSLKSLKIAITLDKGFKKDLKTDKDLKNVRKSKMINELLLID